MQSLEYFSCPVYKTNNTEFIDVVRQVAEENISAYRERGVNDIYPIVMSSNIPDDPRVYDFTKLIAQSAWDVLDSQGYDMSHFTTHIGEMWMQEHHKISSMEQHVHKGYQIVGFYFLETPENCPRAVFYDPRPGKVMMGLPEKDSTKATPASDMINFAVAPGDLILTNAWLPHSFTRNASDEPFRFIHFNIFVQQAHTCAAEVI